ncbi:MAG: MerR family transcriptional regulator [Gammaproteobacteria bacterium]|nr:MAG: MerR family transcriptional regulator [Gammaproteobacteria bacterium]
MQQLLTLGSLAKQTGISRPTLRLYADSGLIPCSVDSTGRRLFPESASEIALRVRDNRTRSKHVA